MQIIKKYPIKFIKIRYTNYQHISMRLFDLEVEKLKLPDAGKSVYYFRGRAELQSNEIFSGSLEPSKEKKGFKIAVTKEFVATFSIETVFFRDYSFHNDIIDSLERAFNQDKKAIELNAIFRKKLFATNAEKVKKLSCCELRAHAERVAVREGKDFSIIGHKVGIFDSEEEGAKFLEEGCHANKKI